MIALVAATLAFQGHLIYLGDPEKPQTRLLLSIASGRLTPAKVAPRKFGVPPIPWEFDWVTAGLVREDFKKSKDFELRFRVFSQIREKDADRGIGATRMLLRLWDYINRRYQLDHAALYNNKIIDFYLCWGGEPGAEQAFGEDRRPGAQVPRRIRGEQILATDEEGDPPVTRKVNTVYLFDLATFTDPKEMVRELCHEYGHAILPPIGGFGPPDDWGNGDIGERIFLRYLRDEMKAGRLVPADAMLAQLSDLEAMVKQQVDPLVMRIAANGPERGLLEGKGQDSLNSLAALAAYTELIVPPRAFVRSLLICGPKAPRYPTAVVEACQELQRVVIDVPPMLKGKNLWVPLGDGKISGASIVKKSGDWAQVKPGLGAILITYPEL